MGWLLSFIGKTTDLLKLFIFYPTYECAGQCSKRWHRCRDMRGKYVLLSNGVAWESGHLGFLTLAHTGFVGFWASTAATKSARTFCWMPVILHLVSYNLSNDIRWVLLASLHFWDVETSWGSGGKMNLTHSVLWERKKLTPLPRDTEPYVILSGLCLHELNLTEMRSFLSA